MKNFTDYVFKSEYKYKFNVNFISVLILINFITYAFYGAVSKQNYFIIELLIYFNFIIFFYYKKKSENLNIFIIFKPLELLILFFLFLFFVFFNIQELTTPLYGDEIATVKRSVRTPYVLSIILTDFTNINFINNLSIKNIIHIVSLVQILAFVVLFNFLKKLNDFFYLFFIIIITFLLRKTLQDYSPHPPLEHIFTTLLSSFFGIGHVVFRLSFIIPFCFFLIFVFQQLRKLFDVKTSILFIFSIATFPVLFFSIYVPDHSFWTSLLFIYVLIYVSINKDININFLVFLISIGVLFRISSFTIFIIPFFLLLHLLVKKKINLKYFIKNKFYFFPILIFLPIFFLSIYGNPAYEGIENVNSLLNFKEAILNGIVLNTFFKQIPYWYFIYVPFLFFFRNRIILITFFIFNIFIYFSIRQELWGYAKYMLEYGVPFFILGQLMLAIYLNKKKLIIFFNLACLLTVFFNIYEIQSYSHKNAIFLKKNNLYDYERLSRNKDSRYFFKTPYPYEKAFNYINVQQKDMLTIFLGTTYGNFPFVLENYSVKDFLKILRINYNLKFNKFGDNHYNNLDNNFKIYLSTIQDIIKISDTAAYPNKEEFIQKINLIEDLEYICIADYDFAFDNSNDFYDFFEKNNWIKFKSIKNNIYNTEIIILKKGTHTNILN